MAMRNYTADDLHHVSLEGHLRRCAEMYFGSRGPNPEYIASHIAEGALILGARSTLVTHREGWWYVCADVDWLRIPTTDGVNEQTVFQTIWAFPEAGVNWHRSEALARVYSDKAFSISEDAIYRVKGDLPTDQALRVHVSRLGSWSRIIGFRFQNAV